MDDPRYTSQPVPDAVIALALGEADQNSPARLTAGEERSVAQIRAIVATMRDQAIEEAPESLVTRLVAIQTRIAIAGGLDRIAQVVTEIMAGVARTFMASLTYDSRVSPALAGFRGTGGATQLAFASPAGGIDLHVTESSGEVGSRVTLRGMIEPAEGPAAPVAHGAMFWLIPSEAAAGQQPPRLSAIIDEDSMFVLHVPPGTYRAMLRLAETAIDLGVLELP